MARNVLALVLRAACGVAVAACGGSAPAPVAPTPPADPVTTAPPPKPADGALAGDPLYRVELGPVPTCSAGAPCEAKLVVRALDGYHVNHEYPTKFVADPASAPLVDGTGVFAAKEGDTTGTMTLSLKPQAAGTARISGTLKLAVCNPEVCEIRAAAIAFDVPVT